MPIEQVLALQPGDVLRLEAPAEGGVTLFADKVPIQHGKPGRSGSRRAVQVTGRVGRSDMTDIDPLIRLGQSTVEAIAGVLEMFAPGKITPPSAPSSPPITTRWSRSPCPPWPRASRTSTA